MEKNKEINEKRELTEEDKKVKKIIREIIPYIVIIFVVLFIKAYIVAPIQVNGDSMYSTLKDGDIMILNKIKYLTKGVERFDIVVVDDDETPIIKRVIGLPGEVIEVVDNKLYIDGKHYKEPYLDEDVETYDFSEKVSDDCYFVMGDNREKSKDSRIIGCVSKDKIEGIAKLTIFPFNRLGNKE